MGLIESMKRLVAGKPVWRRPAVAVEVGGDWIKIAKCKLSFGGTALASLDCLPLSSEAAAGDELVRALATAKCRTKGVTICLPRQLVTLRMLQIPSTDPDEISKIVHLQAGRQTPYSSDEVVSAYRLVGTNAEGYSKVMLAIARRRLVMERLEAIARAGGTVDGVAVASEGVANLLARQCTPKPGEPPTAIVNLDTTAAELLILAPDGIVFSKSLLIGSRQLAEDTDRWQGEFVAEIVAGLEQFGQENPAGGAPRRLVLLGAEELPQVAMALKSACQLELVGGEQLAAIRGGKRARLPHGTRLSAAAVVGCSLDPEKLGIDLLPPEIRLGRVMARRRNQLNLMGLLALFIVTLLSALLVMRYYEEFLTLGTLKQQIGFVRPVAARVEERKARLAAVNNRLDARGTPLAMLAEIHRVTPSQIQLTSVRLGANQEISLRGRGDAMSNVFEYVKALEESPLFQGVEPTYTSAKRVNLEEFAEFAIAARYQPPDPLPGR